MTLQLVPTSEERDKPRRFEDCKTSYSTNGYCGEYEVLYMPKGMENVTGS